jgi:hypothetical protein
MSRPKPTIILSYTNPQTYKADQVLKAEAIYAVFCDGKPINLRFITDSPLDRSAKYKKVSFSNAGHAFNLADKLNAQFKTTRFEVVRLTVGEVIREEKDV